MTEDEARMKLCCAPLYNADTYTYCMASQCMAWRGKYIRDSYGRKTGELGGYCGLAGREKTDG